MTKAIFRSIFTKTERRKRLSEIEKIFVEAKKESNTSHKLAEDRMEDRLIEMQTLIFSFRNDLFRKRQKMEQLYIDSKTST